MSDLPSIQSTNSGVLELTVNKENPEITVTMENWKELFEQSEIMVKEKDYEKAASTLSQLLEFLALHKDLVSQFDLSCYYMLYGKALLSLSQINSNLTVGEVPEAIEVNEEKQTREEVTETKDDEEVSAKETVEEERSVQAEREEGQGKEKEEEEREGEGEGLDVINEQVFSQMMSVKGNNEDREVAWEALETARLLCERCLAEEGFSKDREAQKRAAQTLIDIYSLLGELQMENGNFAGSIEEFEKAICCYHKYGVCQIRLLAFFHFMCVTSAGNARFQDVYEKHLNTTVTLLCERLNEILHLLGNPPNEKNNVSTLEAVTKILEHEETKTKAEPALFEEMAELKAILDEVMCKEKKLPEEDEDEYEEEEEEDETSEEEQQVFEKKDEEKIVVESEKENNQQKCNLSTEQTQDGFAQAKGEDSLCRKRTFGEAALYDETTEPKTKKLKINE